MRSNFSFLPTWSFSRFAGAILAITTGFFVASASASEGKWDYICMTDTDMATGQEVGYLTLHVDIPISNNTAVATTTQPAPKMAIQPPSVSTTTVRPGAQTTTVSSLTATIAAAATPAVATPQKEETVLGALSGEGDFNQALNVVANEAAGYKTNLPGLSEFLLARRSGDTEGFKQWTLNARPLQLKASKDAATGATVVSYRRLMAELRVQIKLGPDYRTVMAGLSSPNAKVFNAAVDKVILATDKATNGGIDYGDFAVQVLHHLKNRAAPVPYTQRTKELGITNSAQ